jgi:formamidopyrimidine-DNA glycosylase
MAISLTASSDEILFNARLHPEQYSDTFNADQLSALHTAIIKVCSIAVSNLADSSQFPENWLFNYRWVGFPASTRNQANI